MVNRREKRTRRERCTCVGEFDLLSGPAVPTETDEFANFPQSGFTAGLKGERNSANRTETCCEKAVK